MTTSPPAPASATTASASGASPHAATALRLRRLLEAEGCRISRGLTTQIMQHMGGGVGMVAVTPLHQRPRPRLQNRVAPELDDGEVVRIPFGTMITVSKARMHLALVEVEYERQYALVSNPSLHDLLRSTSATASTPSANNAHTPFTVRFYAHAEAGNAEDTYHCVAGHKLSSSSNDVASGGLSLLSDAHVLHLRQVEARLEASLTPAETLLAYVGLQAALHGRMMYDGITPLPAEIINPHSPPVGGSPFASTTTEGGNVGGYRQRDRTKSAKKPSYATTNSSTGVAGKGPALAQALEEGRHRIYFYHDNAWMRDWIQSLPPQYDNALELQYPRPPSSSTSRHTSRCRRCSGGTGEQQGTAEKGGRDVSPVLELSPQELPEAIRTRLFLFPRHEQKVQREQGRAYQTYLKCLKALHCLRCLPIGMDMRDSPRSSITSSGVASSGPRGCTANHPISGPLSYTQLLWCLNSVASRGFGFPVEVWVMMPYVDYFNYALEPNMSMQPVKNIRRCQARHRHPAYQEHRFVSRGTTTTQSFYSLAGGSGGPRGSDYDFTFTVMEPIAAGDQLFLSYGRYSDMELLLWYGFTLRPALLPTAMLLQLQHREAIEPLLKGKKNHKDQEEERDALLLTCHVYSTTSLMEEAVGRLFTGSTPHTKADHNKTLEEEEEEAFLLGPGPPPQASGDPLHSPGEEEAMRGVPSTSPSSSSSLFPSSAQRHQEKEVLVWGLERLWGVPDVSEEIVQRPSIRPPPRSGEEFVFRTWLAQELRQEQPEERRGSVTSAGDPSTSRGARRNPKTARHGDRAGTGGGGSSPRATPGFTLKDEEDDDEGHRLLSQLQPRELQKRRQRWWRALQTAYCYLFSPLENIEGEWDEDDEVWGRREPTDSSAKGDEEEEQEEEEAGAAVHLSWFHRLWLHFIYETPPLTLPEALRHVRGRCDEVDVRSTLSNTRRMSAGAPLFYFFSEADARVAVELDAAVRQWAETVLGPALQLSLSTSRNSPITSSGASAPSSGFRLDKDDYCGFGCFSPTTDGQQLLFQLATLAVAKAPNEETLRGEARSATSRPGSGYVPFTPMAREAVQSLRHDAAHAFFLSLAFQKCPGGSGRTLTPTARTAVLLFAMDAVRAMAWSEWYAAASQWNRKTPTGVETSWGAPHTLAPTPMSTVPSMLSSVGESVGGSRGCALSDEEEASTVPAFRVCMSSCAVTRAVQVSEDTAALLYALALRAPAAHLLRYAIAAESSDAEWSSGAEEEEEDEDEVL